MTWKTSITLVEPDNLVIRGIPLVNLIGKHSFLEVAGLLVKGSLPTAEETSRLEEISLFAARSPLQEIPLRAEDDVSKQLAAFLYTDMWLASFKGNPLEMTAACLGRVAIYMAKILNEDICTLLDSNDLNFTNLICQALAGQHGVQQSRLLEAIIVACVDHGVTPPSAQATILASTVRPAFEVAIAAGVSAITDVHGGAGQKAAVFFSECIQEDLPPLDAAIKVISKRLSKNQVIQGLGHRVHKQDPRRDALWIIAEETGFSGKAVEVSKVAGEAMKLIKDKSLPVNVDGVIGAIVTDMGLDARLAKALFIVGRVAGLCAHHFEEISTQKAMRKVDFADVIYEQLV